MIITLKDTMINTEAIEYIKPHNAKTIAVNFISSEYPLFIEFKDNKEMETKMKIARTLIKIHNK